MRPLNPPLRSPTAPRAGPASHGQTQPYGSLGPRLALYRARPVGQRQAVFLALAGTLVILGPLMVGRYLYVRAILYGPAAAAHASLPWYLLALAALLLYAASIFYRLRMTRRLVAIHQRGIVVKLGRSRVLPWGHITGIAVGYTQEYILTYPLRTRFRAWLVPGVGKPLALDERLEHLPELVTRLKAHLYPRLLAAIQAEFQAGKWVHFGPLAIHQRSLRLPGESIPWSDVKNLTIVDGDLVVALAKGRPRYFPVWRIPNVELLLQLIQSGVF